MLIKGIKSLKRGGPSLVAAGVTGVRVIAMVFLGEMGKVFKTTVLLSSQMTISTHAAFNAIVLLVLYPVRYETSL